MLYRLLGVFACLFPIGWGLISIRAGIKSDEFGPVLGGLIFAALGAIVLILIVFTMLEQIMNDSSEVIDPNEHDPY